jgi:hypothetical protein
LTWIRSATFAAVGALYFIAICMLPVFFAMMFLEVPDLREIPLFSEWAPRLAMVSPITVELCLFHEMGPRFPRDVSTVPFYVVHGILLGWTLFEIRRRGQKVRAMYLAEPDRE